MGHETFDIFLVIPPGLETALEAEARATGFESPVIESGGVTVQGTWEDVWRANLLMRTPTKILARIGGFRAFHLAQLDKRARAFDWSAYLRPDQPLRVDVTTRGSKIYHAKAAAQRIERALTEEMGITIAKDAAIELKARIDDNMVTFSLDTSGESLHKRGHKVAVGKAPMRENMAAAFLSLCGFDGQEPVVDPMCGSGTFVIEAAEIAAGLAPGRDRDFAFMGFANFDPARWAGLKAAVNPRETTVRFHGSDRDQGAIQGATRNADRAGVAQTCLFNRLAISDLTPPEGPKGLVIINPPYGARIGERKPLFALYGAMGEVLRTRFRGWRVGIITPDGGLAAATGLPFLPPGPPIAHGGIGVKLFLTAALP